MRRQEVRSAGNFENGFCSGTHLRHRGDIFPGAALYALGPFVAGMLQLHPHDDVMAVMTRAGVAAPSGGAKGWHREPG